MGGKYFIKRASQEILRERGSIEKAAKSFDEERSAAATIGGGREETNVDQDLQAHKHGLHSIFSSSFRDSKSE